MIRRIKLIQDGRIRNIIIGDNPADYAGDGITADFAGDGDAIYVPPIVPESVTPRQLKQWLITDDKMKVVDAIFASMPEGTEKDLALNYWNESTEFRRDHPLVAEIGAALKMASDDIDQAFIEAALL